MFFSYSDKYFIFIKDIFAFGYFENKANMEVIYPNPNKKMELVVTWPVDILWSFRIDG